MENVRRLEGLPTPGDRHACVCVCVCVSVCVCVCAVRCVHVTTRIRAQAELCESQSRWQSGWLVSVPNKPTVSVDVKQYSTNQPPE